MTTKTLLLAGALLAGMAAPAAAQTIGTARPVVAIASAKAYNDAATAITTQYKAQLDQADAKRRQQQQLLAQLDRNNDKQVDDSEMEAARAAKNPALPQVETLNREIGQLQQPAVVAQIYVLEQLLQRYDAAQTKVATDRRLTAVLSPEAVLYLPANSDISQAITAELDRTFPTAVTTPPANWQPNQAAVGLFQQIQQLQQLVAQQQARQGQGAAPTTPPAATPPTPAGNKKPQSR